MSTVPDLVFDKSVRDQKSSRLRSIVSSLVVTSLTVGLTVAVPKSASAAAGEGAGSVAVGMAGGAGNVDERTGLMSFGNQLGVVPGAGAAQVDLGVTYAQSQAGESDGLGGGMSWGLPHLRGGDTLVLADGRDFHLDPTAWSGLGDYALANLKLTRFETALPAGAPGCDATRPCGYALTDSTGTREVFDIEGLLGARTDHFGNTARFDFDPAHRLIAVHGGYPDAPVTATIEYSGSSDVTINFPTTTTGLTPHAHLHFANNLLDSVTDTAGNQLDLSWANYRIGGVDTPLLTSTLTSTGARMQVTYRQYDPGIWAVDRIETLDAATGRPLTAPIQFNLNPDGNPDGHNYTGYPRYHTTVPGPDTKTTDPLVASNDKDYHYTTSVSDGNVTTYRQFDHLHRKTAEWSTAHIQGEERQLSTTTMSYPDQDATWPNVPVNYQLPATTTNTTIDPLNPTITRTATISSSYDDLGREIERTANGVRTVTSYDTALTQQPDTPAAATDPAATDFAATDVDPGRGYGLVLSTRTTVLDGDQAGTTITTTNDLTADRGAIATATTTTSTPDGHTTTNQTEHTTYTPTGEPAHTETTGYSTDGTPTSTTQTLDYTVENGLRTLTVTDADGVSTSTGYDPATGQPVTQTDSAGLTTTTTYDEHGQVASITDPTGVSTHTTYEQAGIGGQGTNQTTTTRDSDGYTVREVRDTADRVVLTQDNQNGDTLTTTTTDHWRPLSRTAYNERGQQVSTTDQGDRTTTYQYDLFGQVETVTNPDGTRTHSETHPATGTQTDTTFLPHAAQPTTTNTTVTDTAGRITHQSTTHQDNSAPSTTDYSYSGLGNITGERDNQGRTATNTYTPTGDLTGTTVTGDRPEAAAGYHLDGLGRPLAKTVDIDGQTAQSHTTTYTPAGRVSSTTDPAGNTTHQTYDPAGRPITVTYPDGRTQHTSYHPTTGQITGTWWTTADSDQHLEEIGNSYDTNGHLAATWYTADPTGSRIEYTYLPDGSPRTISYPDGSAITYTYNPDGSLHTLTSPDGTTTTYTYDQTTGRMTSAAQPQARVDYTYDPAGRVDRIDRSNPHTSAAIGATTYTYNDAGQILTERHTDAGGALLEDHRYTWNTDGLLDTDVSTLGETVPVPTDGPLAGQRTTTTTHAYDPQQRLQSTSIHAGTDPTAPALTSTDYRFNAASDLTGTTTTTPTGTTTTTYTIDPAGRQTTITTDGVTTDQQFDGNGNLTRDADGTTYTYTPSGNLNSWTLTDGTTSTLTWRPDGTRNTKTDPTGTTTTTYALPGTTVNVLTETTTNPTGASTTHTGLEGLTREAQTTTGTTTGTDWLLTNRRGDITTTQNTTGTPTSHTTYTDYGTPTTTGTTTHQPFGYAGNYTDNGPGGTGLQWNSLRHYNPRTATFTTKDPTPLLNRYTYAAGDPINYTDPTGRSPEWLNTKNMLNIGMALVGFIGIAGGPITIALGITSAIAGALVVANDITPYMPDNIAQGLAIGAIAGSALAAGGGILRGGTTLTTASQKRSLAAAVGVAGLAIGGGLTYFGIRQTVKNAQEKNSHIPPNEDQETPAARQSARQAMNLGAAGNTSPGALDGAQKVGFDPNNADHLVIKEAEVQAARRMSALMAADLINEPNQAAVTLRNNSIHEAWKAYAIQPSQQLNEPGQWKPTIYTDGTGKALFNDGSHGPRGGVNPRSVTK